jgi:hypothetical protein
MNLLKLQTLQQKYNVDIVVDASGEISSIITSPKQLSTDAQKEFLQALDGPAEFHVGIKHATCEALIGLFFKYFQESQQYPTLDTLPNNGLKIIIPVEGVEDEWSAMCDILIKDGFCTHWKLNNLVYSIADEKHNDRPEIDAIDVGMVSTLLKSCDTVEDFLKSLQ